MGIHRALGAFHRRRFIVAAGSVAVLIGTLGTATDASAVGPGLIASTSALTATLSTDGSTVTFADTIDFLNLHKGLGITPSGTVSFTDDQGDNLGTAGFPKCFNIQCVVTETIPVTDMRGGVTIVAANYSGDTLLKPSSATAPVGFGDCTTGSCQAYTTNSTTTLNVTADSNSGYVVDSIGGQGLPCGVPNGGDVGQVNASGLNTTTKQVNYSVVGSGAEAENNQVNGVGGNDWFCYVAPDEFNAYAQSSTSTLFPDDQTSYQYFGPAPQIAGGPYQGDYAGLLPDCTQTFSGDGGPITITNPPPCIAGCSIGQNSDSNNQWQFNIVLDVPSGDPWLGGKQLIPPQINSSL